MKLTKISLISLQLLVMLNAFGGGYYGLAGASGIARPGWRARPSAATSSRASSSSR